MRIACWIRTAADTHAEYVTFTCFLGQQWSRKRASMLRLYVHCLSHSGFLDFCVFHYTIRNSSTKTIWFFLTDERVCQMNVLFKRQIAVCDSRRFKMSVLLGLCIMSSSFKTRVNWVPVTKA